MCTCDICETWLEIYPSVRRFQKKNPKNIFSQQKPQAAPRELLPLNSRLRRIPSAYLSLKDCMAWDWLYAYCFRLKSHFFEKKKKTKPSRAGWTCAGDRKKNSNRSFFLHSIGPRAFRSSSSSTPTSPGLIPHQSAFFSVVIFCFFRNRSSIARVELR